MIPWLTAALAAPPLLTHELGADQGAGNVLGIQAWVEPGDYATPAHLARVLHGWMRQADDRGWVRSDTVVVLPEYIGTWLIAAGERPAVYRAERAEVALRKVVFARLWRFLGTKPDAEVTDPTTYAVFAMKGEPMAEAYQQVMSELAATWGVTLVGGSILLPEPRVEDGAIRTRPGGPLHNVAFVFGPDGTIVGGPVIKAFPTAHELGFTTPGEVDALEPVQTAAGTLGVLVCADGWFPDAHRALGEVDVLVVPQYTAGDGAWSEPWGGYSGWPAPDDVAPDDIGRITEGEAWAVYGPTGRSEAPVVMTVPLRGALWDLGDDAPARGTLDGAAWEGPLADAPVLLNVWRSR